MRLKKGDVILKNHPQRPGGEYRYTVKNVSGSYVELENGDYVSITEIEQDVKHDTARVIKNDSRSLS